MKNMEVSPGTEITRACRDAVALSASIGDSVSFDFNGVTVVCNPGDEADLLAEKWHAGMEENRRAYEASDKGIAERLRRKEQVTRSQSKVDWLLSRLDLVATDESALMNWLYEFTGAADDCEVHFDRGGLSDVLQAAGWQPNANVIPIGATKAAASKMQSRIETVPSEMAKYIVGQVLSCLAMNMPPHPMTMSFVERYRAIAKATGATP